MHDDLPIVPGDSAPEAVAWCSRCAGPMQTREMQGKPRRVCTRCGFIHFVEAKVAVGVCVVEEDRLLLVRRRFNPEKGKWSLPAGFLDSGDEPRMHAQREARQETGLTVRIQRLMDVFYNPPQAGGATLFVLYEAQRVAGSVRAGDDAVEVGFFPVHELPELAFASTRRAVELLRGDSQPEH